MNFSFYPEAEDEFNVAIEYYETVSTGLVYDFRWNSKQLSNG